MADNYGIKISLPGNNTSTASASQLSFDSSYDTFKLKLSNINTLFNVVTVFFANEPPTPVNPTTVNLYKIAHGYNYQPFILVLGIDSSYSGFSAMSTSAPSVMVNGYGYGGSYFYLSATENTAFQIYADATYFYINLFTDNSKFLTFRGNYYTFKYYIFSENGF